MREPDYITGDDFARGFVDECPECEDTAFDGTECGSCGYTTDGGWDDHEYERSQDDYSL